MKITIITMEHEGRLSNSKKENGSEIKTRCSDYARFFDRNIPYWTFDPEMNMSYLRSKEIYANWLLKHRGYLFLNEVYDMLGMPKSKDGQVVGWVYSKEKPIGDNYVDFGIYDIYDPKVVKVDERSILLDFNVDGFILDKI